MDASELDEWLGTSGTADPEEDDQDRPPWRAPRTDGSAEPGGEGPRRPWMRIAGGAAVVWVLAMLVLAVRGGGEEPVSGEPPPVTAAAVPASATAPEESAPEGSAVRPPTAASTPASVTTPAPVASTTPAAPQGDHEPPWSEAILAVRQHLAGAGAGSDGTDRYLEWAAPGRSRPLPGGARLLVVDAVWLEGTDGVYDRSVRGQWAVPVSEDATVASTPWLVTVDDLPTPPQTPPPAIRQRAEEAQQALLDGGWSEVVVHGSEPHPELPGLWVVALDGVDPSGASHVAAIAWLEDVEGFSLLGTQP